jgi:GNAT superfamily N-acetyltransferase
LRRTAPVAGLSIASEPKEVVAVSSIEIRAFERRDREQLTELVNAHVDAVVPGRSVSVNAVLSQLEREPGEVVVDPWVTERATLVAVRREQVVAAALLTRFAEDARVSDSYRGSAELRWLLCWPQHADAADALAAACVATMDRWGARTQWADGSLPAPSVYGIPDSWPHVRGVLERAGFEPGGRVEVVVAAAVADLPQAGAPPADELAVRRVVGRNGTAFEAVRGEEPVGLFELRSDVTTGGALSRLAGWGEVWNLHVDEGLRRRGVGSWLVGHGANWLRLGEVRMLLAEHEAGNEAGAAFLRAVGFRELTRTERGWARKS